MFSSNLNKQISFCTKRNKKFYIICTFFISALYILYQFLMYYQVSNEKSSTKTGYLKITDPTLVKGIHLNDKSFYTPVNGKFQCIKSGELIDFHKVNDNYCDCMDSTDEPGTNACPDGSFNCLQISTKKFYPKVIHSSRVNDGICDCCDGSDEYNSVEMLGGFKNIFKSIKCTNVC
ncbi:hypothetical protein ABEB36_005637 [Hypothenemus hampei]|uniref:Glucosidase II beta subunit N-terminal domain-containing protein n=1 Tax=Hypothenemus hampei TaxID=57062 RepID=A0ABD1F1K7_HYPHA